MEAALSTLDLSVLQSRLIEAIDAVHALKTGRKVASVNHTGRSLEYQDIKGLEAYIAQLQAAIQAKETGQPVRSPLYMVF